MILLISPKGVYATKRFIEEAKKAKVKLDAFDKEDLAKKNFKIDISRYDTLFFRQSFPYEKEIFNLAKEFVKAGKKVIDEPKILEDVIAGKWRGYKKLEKAGFPTIQSFLLKDDFNFKILNSKPYIIKWIYGLKGKEVFLVENENQLSSIIKKFPKEELIVQDFIKADYEYKVITVGYKSVPVVLRFKMEDEGFRVNFDDYQVIKKGDALEVVSIAEKASRVLKRELAKVDILEKDGKLYVLEVNRWPGLKNFEENTKYNLTRDFVSYLSGFTKKAK